MTKEQLSKYIEVSFISEINKRKLVGELAKGASVSDVQNSFEDLLIEKINDLGDKYENALDDFGTLSAELGKEISLQEVALDRVLDEKLAKINRSDYDARTKIWDEYYADVDKLNSGYEKKLKTIISKIIIKSMK